MQNLRKAIPGSITIKFEVQVSPENGFLDQVSRLEYQEILRALNYQPSAYQYSQSDIKKYLYTLMVYRVMSVTNRLDLVRIRTHMMKRLRIPTHWAVLIQQVGEAFDKNFNFKFVPTMEVNADLLLTYAEMVDISNSFEAIPDYLVNTAWPQGNEGDVYTMSTFVFQQENYSKVMAYHNEHPVKAFFAALLNTNVISHVYEDLIMLYRMEYPSTDEMLMELTDVYRSKDPS